MAMLQQRRLPGHMCPCQLAAVIAAGGESKVAQRILEFAGCNQHCMPTYFSWGYACGVMMHLLDDTESTDWVTTTEFAVMAAAPMMATLITIGEFDSPLGLRGPLSVSVIHYVWGKESIRATCILQPYEMLNHNGPDEVTRWLKVCDADDLVPECQEGRSYDHITATKRALRLELKRRWKREWHFHKTGHIDCESCGEEL